MEGNIDQRDFKVLTGPDLANIELMNLAFETWLIKIQGDVSLFSCAMHYIK